MAKQNILIIDTETTGLPPRSVSYDNSQAWSKCRMVQVAWHVYDPHGVLLEKEEYILQPDGWTVPSEAQNIHGISTHMAMTEGVPITHVFERFHDIFPTIRTVVAHNIAFDKAVLLSEMVRYKQQTLHDLFSSMDFHCTMKTNTLPGQKWPKLVDLYTNIFGCAPQGTLHQADTDVAACAEIYWHNQK